MAPYRVIRSYHDLCDEEYLDESIEDAIHDYEDSCGGGCNAMSAAYNPNTCSPKVTSGATSAMVRGIKTVTALEALAFITVAAAIIAA